MTRRSKSSGRWLREHFDDPFVQRARQEGWRSRAAFKLQEIDRAERLVFPGAVIVDLGAAPGGWSQYASRALAGRGTVVAVDVLAMDRLPDVTFLQGDFREQAVLDELLKLLAGRRADLVMSDMAPNMSGVDVVDQARAADLEALATAPTGSVRKVSRHSLAEGAAAGGWSATTVSGTMIAATRTKRTTLPAVDRP